MMQFHTPLSVVIRRALSAASALASLVRTIILGPRKYHPEQHYMRGPGPKWREKHSFDITTRGM